MNVAMILSIISALVLFALVVRWKLNRTQKQLDEAVHKIGVNDAIIKTTQTAKQIKNSNAERSGDDRRERMRGKKYLRSSK